MTVCPSPPFFPVQFSPARMSLQESIERFVESPDVAKTFRFEQLYTMVYKMCIQQKHEQVRVCLTRAIERIYGTPHAEFYRARLNDIAAFYNQTCTQKGLPAFMVMYEEYRPSPVAFDTPPGTP